MDVERDFDQMEIEADVSNNFDDIILTCSKEKIYCQIKDIGNISVDELKIESSRVRIQNKWHSTSDYVNVIFFKSINCLPNTKFYGIPAYKISNILIISISSVEAEQIVENLYENNESRKSQISRFFKNCLDSRNLLLKKESLPSLDTFSTELVEETVKISRNLLSFDRLLHIEGRPGVGKSHLVSRLADDFENPLVYRFWVSNQDRNYRSRLIYQNFLNDVNKKLFHDIKKRTEEELIKKISEVHKVMIIDGLDHVENYHDEDLSAYIKFIDYLSNECKVIVLSRPLKYQLNWKKQFLANWNFDQTRLILSELHHLTDYKICGSIYNLTDGYPILVRFVIEHYKKYGELPLDNKIANVNSYYERIVSTTQVIKTLSLFLCVRSYIMKSEIESFIGKDFAFILIDFIETYPYLFEIRLNRISLFHDSFNTYLLSLDIPHSEIGIKVRATVYQSLLDKETKYLSRFSSYYLTKNEMLTIILKYTSIKVFEKLLYRTIDYEALRSFYVQIREALIEIDAESLEIKNYYDLSLILNMLYRDHFSTDDRFLYTYVKTLIVNDFSEEDITSSESLFGMYVFYKTNDATFLFNLRSNSHYDTENFFRELSFDIESEEYWFKNQSSPMTQEGYLVNSLLTNQFFDSLEYLPLLLANLYIHDTEIEELKSLQIGIRTYIDSISFVGVNLTENALKNFPGVSARMAPTYLKYAEEIILSVGYQELSNEYIEKSLEEIILSNSHSRSYTVATKVHNYLRLSWYKGEKIDLKSINRMFAMYHMRKDYSVYNIDEALKVFEDDGLIEVEESIEIIKHIQSMSEKGVRHLLASYIELHSPKIIFDILSKYHPDHYEIQWFLLDAKYINEFSDDLFDYALNEVLSWSSHRKEIKLDDIKNVLRSKRMYELVKTLNFLNYKVSITNDDHEKELLNKLGVEISEASQSENYDYLKDAYERFCQGIIDLDSSDLIRSKGLKASEVAKYTDGNHAVLADLNLYKIFNRDDVVSESSQIIRNALSARIYSIDGFAVLYHLPGNIPKFAQYFDLGVDRNELFDSFISFLKLSLLIPEIDTPLQNENS